MNLTGPDAKYLRLYLSAKTVRNHVSNISTKLHRSQTELGPSSAPARLGRGA